MAVLRVFKNGQGSVSASIDAYEFEEAGTVVITCSECAGFGSFVLSAGAVVGVVVEESPLKVSLAVGDAFTAGDFPFELVSETATTSEAVKLQDLAGRSYAITATGACVVTLLVAK